ncbi:MAG: hypothetical protein B7Z60_07465 [Ferrovum sp. 37-45-19]|jgi:uncharacterized metal-binding protein|uniref:hypothetical protein n=1 Tax=Ferrovum sp. JA12 TaxID=1356299 RepID=UPI000703444C|nr:hypothetical protein [Ferrovum sp. JA12]OYV79144.1 MAG: hypothetical protein B7Z65_07585 [Ferrovum sp. 21-44-67]OYV93726.1 MAG: hypothetical protein B7Z60_07465 [Ferrovum sp. 37-45-19]OZB32259.1 MAG: hypothetical protein B7X47_06810 [Ferrovum sp. 34-44-207]HQT81332.1 hypothetical protein [Ferrovaceae bacterium]KRH78574.1 hypothetical protein FERRO_15650 [Ferrovum sp. JA12]
MNLYNANIIEWDFVLLVFFSFIAPFGIYYFLSVIQSISRTKVVMMAFSLLVISGVDVTLLQRLSHKVMHLNEPSYSKFFQNEFSLALYILPALFAGIAINLISHVLIEHIHLAEKRFDAEQKSKSQHRP